MNNALLYIGGILIVVLSALFAVPYFVDWNRYRGVFEEEATRILGRDVRVGGAVNLRLLPAPYVSFEKLKISDVGSSARESVFRADSFTMWLSVPPLLKGVIEARKIELRRPMLRLVSNAEGGGNWQSLTMSSGDLPFVPKAVALQSVTLVDGLVSFGGPKQADLATLEHIDGELSAETLSGPFKFVGKLSWHGQRRDVRLSTASLEANGDTRFKASVRALDTGNSYVLAGKVADFKGKPKLEGELTALMHLAAARDGTAANGTSPPLQSDAPAASTAAGEASDLAPDLPDRPALLPVSEANGAAFELRSKVTGDVNGVALDDLNLSFEHDGPPQIIAGSARLSWPDRLKTELTLASRWIDLDRVIAGKETRAVPLPAARGLFEAVARSLPETADTEATLTLDQVTLGGEALSSVSIAAARSGGGPLEIRGIRAGLPGGARFDLDGALSGLTAERSFDGFVSVAGPSLARLLSWGFQQAAVVPGRAEGAFAFDGRLRLKTGQVDVSDASVEIAGMPLTGAFSWTQGERTTAALSLEGHRIDVGNLWPGALEPDRLARLAGLPAGPSAPAAATEAGDGGTAKPAKDIAAPPAAGSMLPENVDVKLKLHASELVDGERRLSGVDADIAVLSGKLSMPLLRFSTAAGVAVDLEGEATGLSGEPSGRTTGVVRGTVAAPRSEALAALGEFIGVSGAHGLDAARLGDLAPLRVAGTLELGKRLASSADLTFDGSSNGGRLTGRALLDGGWSSWRGRPADIALTLDQPHAARIAEAIIGAAPSAAPASGTEQAHLTVKASGTASESMLVAAELTAPSQSLVYDGRIGLGEGGETHVSGDVVARNSDARTILAMAGIALSGGVQSRVQGAVAVESDQGKTILTPRELIVGGAKVNGRVVVTTKAESTVRHVDADLAVDQATIPGLMSAVLEAQAAAPIVAPPPEPAVKEPGKSRRKEAVAAAAAPPPLPDVAPTIWPGQSFDQAMFRDVEGRLELSLGSLALEPGLAMSDVNLKAAIAPGSLRVESFEGKGIGGRISSAFVLDKAAAGVALSGSVSIAVPGPSEARQGAAPDAGAAEDAVKFALDFSGRALSLSGLMSTLSGKGEVRLADASLSGNTPKAVADVSEAALGGKGANSGDELAGSLKTALKEGTLRLGKLALPVKLADGVMSLDKLEIDTADGRATLQAMVELQTMRLDSEWQIEPRVTREVPPPAAPAGAAPAAEPQAAPDAAAGEAPAVAPPVVTERVLLPALTVTYAGKLRDYARLEPIVATAALERELSVRKMERDVDELERLRRQDQARAKADLERQKALEAERTRQLENLNAPWPLPDAAGAAPELEATNVTKPAGDGEPSGDVHSAGAGPDDRPEVAVPRRTYSQPPRPKVIKKRPTSDWKPFQIQQF